MEKHKRHSSEIEEYLASSPDIEWFEYLVPLQREKRGFFQDPYYNYQWHLVYFPLFPSLPSLVF